MKILNTLVKITDQRVKKYGAQYNTFATFGLLNYPLAALIEIYYMGNTSGVWIRFIASLLCFGLIFNQQWSEKLKKFLPLYWYCTIIFSLPMLTTFLLLKDNLSILYLMNFNIGVMILVLLLDSLSFILSQLIGIVLGIILFYLTSEKIPNVPNTENSLLFLYMFLCITILGSIFSRNREIFNNFLQKAKDEANLNLESAVRERTKELEEALRSKTEFLNNMSHEVRTPIVGVEGISQGLVDNWERFTDQEKYEYAKQVVKNAGRLRSLVGNLLDLSKFTSGKMLLDKREMDVSECIRSIIDESEELYIQGKAIKLKYEDFGIQKIIGDEERISQVLRNLFVNAIKFSLNNRESEIRAELVAVKWNGVDSVKFSLRDEGVGIPEGELEKIFEPFTQSTKTKTKAGGTGLGLSICKEIIESHGGKIWARNNENKIGVTLNFVLPIGEVKGKEEADLKEREKRRKRILMIDDEEACLTSMDMILMSGEYSMVKAEGGIKGLEILSEISEDIDLILLDLMMPDMYGLDVLKAIKQEKKYEKIPVILQSGTSEQSVIEEAIKLGTAGYIKKPYSKESVLSEIKKVI